MIAKAITKFLDTPYDNRDSGISCEFVRLNEEWGVKCYPMREDRDHTYFCQRLAAESGLAPKVREKFTIRRDELTLYGYLTQVIRETVKDRMREAGYGNIRGGRRWVHSAHYHNLYTSLASIGFTPMDMHWANVGYLHGKIVCIDFSHFLHPQAPYASDWSEDYGGPKNVRKPSCSFDSSILE